MTQGPFVLPIKFKPGARVMLINSKHFGQRPIVFQTQEVLSYKGRLLLYGTILAHEIHVPTTHGRVRIPERPSCPVVCPTDVVEQVEAFVAHVGGVPWYFVHRAGDTKGVPILNGPMPNEPLEVRDRQSWMVDRAAALVDSFQSFMLTGDVDQEYRRLLDKLRGVKRNPLWTPEGGT